MAADLLINKNPNLSPIVYFSMNKARVKRSGRQISQDVAEISHFAESGEICQRSCVDSTIQSPKTYSFFLRGALIETGEMWTFQSCFRGFQKFV